MKCKYCGGNLTLEEKFCPHCGKENEHARQHVSDMQKYQGAFADTQSDVYSVTRKFSGITARAVIIVVLLLVIVIMAVVGSEAYSIKRNLEQANSATHRAEYMGILDAYLEMEEYLAFDAFCDAHYIDGFDDGFEKYRPILSTAGAYSDVYYYMMEVVLAEDEVSRERMLGYLGERIEYFYEHMNMSDYKYFEGAVCEENEQIMQRMEENILVLLQAHCGFSEEDAAGFGELSQAKRMVLIEERLNGK